MIAGMELYGRKISGEKMRSIIYKIRQKKELALVPDDVVVIEIRRFLEQNSGVLDALANSAELDLKSCVPIVKFARARLRRKVGLFQESFTSEIQGVAKSFTREDIYSFLEKHASTKERMAYLDSFLKIVFSDLHEKSKVLDLGGGIFPLVLRLPEVPSVVYASIDISGAACEFLRQALSTKHAEVLQMDLAQEIPTGHFSRVFAFKVFDLLEHKRVEELLQEIDSHEFYCSFSTKTITGQRMNNPRRAWFTKMLRRKQWAYETIEFPGELLYKVSK